MHLTMSGRRAVLALVFGVLMILTVLAGPYGAGRAVHQLKEIVITDHGEFVSRTVSLGDGLFQTELYMQPSGRGRDVQTLQPGSEGIDTFISQTYPTYNYGLYSKENSQYYPILYVGKDTYTADNSPALGVCRALVKFDLSALPDGITAISEAKISLNYYGYYGVNGTTLTIEMHSMTTDWTEGNGVGDVYSAGSGASWNTKDGSTPWTTPGGDYDAATISTVSLPVQSSPEPWGFYDWEATNLVQQWVDQSKPNYGVMFKYDSENINNYAVFASSDINTATDRPKLTITYTMNQRPTAQITNYPVDTVYTGQAVTLEGNAWDNDGTVIAYKWTSNLNGILGTSPVITVNNLTVGTHTINFTAQDDRGAWSLPATVHITVEYNEKPSKVLGLTAHDTYGDDGGSITVEWLANEDSDFGQYNVYVFRSRIDNTTGQTPAIDPITTQSTTSVDITAIGSTPIRNNVDYWVAVTVTDIHGLENTDASVVGPVQAKDDHPPDPLSMVSASDTPGDNGGSITLQWQKTDARDFDHYNIYIDDVEFFDLNGMQPEIDDIKSASVVTTSVTTYHNGKPLVNGKDYWLAVAAVDKTGNINMNATVVGPVKPLNDLKPTQLTVTLQDTPNDQGTSLTITWSKATDTDFDHYEVYVSETEDIFSSETELKLTDPTATISNIDTTSYKAESCLEGPIEPGKSYYAIVTVVDTGGNMADFVVQGPTEAEDNVAPPKITGITAEDTPGDDGGAITVTWDKTDVNDFDHYAVYVADSAMITPGVTQPEITINNIDTASVSVTTAGQKPIKDGNAYYIAVVCFDRSGNYILDPIIEGPVIAADNIPPRVSSYTPEELNVTVDKDHSQTFEVILSHDEKGRVSYAWYLGNKKLPSTSSKETITYDSVEEGGNYTVKVVLTQEDMALSHTWNVSIIQPETEKPSTSKPAEQKGFLEKDMLYIIVGIAILAVSGIAVAVILIRKKKEEEAEAQEDNRHTDKSTPRSTMQVQPPTYYGKSLSHVYGGPYSSGEPLYHMDQSYQTYSNVERTSTYNEGPSTMVEKKETERLSDKLMKTALKKKKKRPELPPAEDEEPKALARLPPKKVLASQAKSLEAMEREEKLKKLEEKKKRGEICDHQNEDVKDYVCPSANMKKCKLKCIQKNYYAASKMAAVIKGKPVKRCIFQNSKISVFVCPRNLRENCELDCSQKTDVKKIKKEDWAVCPKDGSSNPPNAKKCKKCGANLLPEKSE